MEPTLRAHRIRTVNASSHKLISVLVKRCPTDIACRIGVYIIPCKDCNLMYIGQTGKSLEVRFNQHKDAILKHVRGTNHEINWRAAKHVFNSKVESHR